MFASGKTHILRILKETCKLICTLFPSFVFGVFKHSTLNNTMKLRFNIGYFYTVGITTGNSDIVFITNQGFIKLSL